MIAAARNSLCELRAAQNPAYRLARHYLFCCQSFSLNPPARRGRLCNNRAMILLDALAIFHQAASAARKVTSRASTPMIGVTKFMALVSHAVPPKDEERIPRGTIVRKLFAGFLVAFILLGGDLIWRVWAQTNTFSATLKYSVTYSAGGSCAPGPAYQVFPVLVQLQ